MANKKKVTIDTQAFDKWFNSLNLKQNEFNTKIGVEGAYNNTMKRGFMTITTHKLMCLVFQLPMDSFIVKDESIKPETEQVVEEDNKDLLEYLKSIDSKLTELITMLK